MNRLIFGKNNIQQIVGCEIRDTACELFVQREDGSVEVEVKSNKYWIVADRPLDSGFIKLEGSLFYKYIKYYDTRDAFLSDRSRYYRANTFSIFNEKEAAMVLRGFTYFKGLKLEDVSVLSFDIETTGLVHDDSSKVLLIANTFKKNGKTIRKMFAYDEFDSDSAMFDAWCEWVREMDPSILVSHNGVIYDLPYLEYCASKAGSVLNLGRDGSALRFDSRESQFRKDGSQSYSYKRAFIYGREIIDTFFLSIKYDVQRKYESYKLKQIIKQEGLEVKDRQFYDAGEIRNNYKDPVEWEKIKKYAEMDGDDALALFNLMAPSFFYLTQSIPKSFQSIIESASGSQINSLMIRSYLQEGHSLPVDSEAKEYEGAISLGTPGLYKHVWKVDVASLYPSLILTHKVYDKFKDPNGNFLKMIQYFTDERLNNKRLAKETGNRYYKDLEQSQKIIINSGYGFLGAQKLLFNSPANAALITQKGREVLTNALAWAQDMDFSIVNADTDSISISDGSPLAKEDRDRLLADLNSLFPSTIHFEDDGYYQNVLVIKVKNYYLESEDGKHTIKGSALKASMKEPALKEFIKEFIYRIVNKGDLLELYYNYIREILELKDISRWCSKKTVTASVLDPERTNEQRVKDAIDESEDLLQEGDKALVYFNLEGNLKLAEKWNNDHDPFKLLEKLWKTVSIFSTVIDIAPFTKYHLKRQRKLLEGLTNPTDCSRINVSINQ